MGVDVTIYFVYGLKLDYDSCKDLIEDNYDENGELIYDGMSGGYVVLGLILYDSGFIWETCSDDFEAIDVSKLVEMKQDYIERFQESHPQHAHLLEGEWTLFGFKHYS